jgi:Nif-specific regulatory protein
VNVAEVNVSDAGEPVLDGLAPLGDLDASLLRILDQVREHCGARRASLFLRDPETGDLVTRVAHLEEVAEIRVAAGRGVVGAAHSRGETVMWPGDAPEPDAAAVAAIGWRPESLLAVPLRFEDHQVGVLEVIDPSEGGRARRRAERLALRLERVLAASSLGPQLRPRGERTVSLAYAYEGVVGDAPAMRRAFALAARVAGTDASVLITGETGTGKELFARALHVNSRRAHGALVKVDCGAIPDSLIENELFGHEKGAFTGATGSSAGRFEEAHDGTLFLDEVGELSTMAQTRLLRVLNDRVVQRLGGGKPKAVDFRLIAATHVDLAARAHEGEFRLDLLHRLKVVRIRLPSLRERGRDDILRLVEHFAELHGRRHDRPVRVIPESAQDLLAEWWWPGNVRELSHAVEAAVVLTPDGVLSPDLFELEGPPVDEAAVSGAAHPFDAQPTMEGLERDYLRYLMERHGGARQEVARVAGIGRSTLWRKLKEMGVD